LQQQQQQQRQALPLAPLHSPRLLGNSALGLLLQQQE
jgi:hypothetical protein